MNRYTLSHQDLFPRPGERWSNKANKWNWFEIKECKENGCSIQRVNIHNFIHYADLLRDFQKS